MQAHSIFLSTATENRRNAPQVEVPNNHKLIDKLIYICNTDFCARKFSRQSLLFFLSNDCN